MPFEFTPTQIPDVVEIQPQTFGDNRGFFAELYQLSSFEAQNIPPFVQDNLSRSQKGTLRGLHYQMDPHAQGKLVLCLEGEIFDVAVDMRKGSPTYGKYISRVLSAEKKNMLYIPPGFAHGFYVLSDTALFHYKNTSEYKPETSRTLRWNDPTVDIEWPFKSEPILSEQDKQGSSIDDIENNFTYD